MPRISIPTLDQTPAATRPLLDAVTKQLGVVPQGNLAENPKAHLFLIDYANRQRIKLWGEARVIEDDAALLAELMPKDGKSRGEQVLEFQVLAWDANCPKHIPQRFDALDIARVLEQRDRRIAELEAEVRRLSNPRTQYTSA